VQVLGDLTQLTVDLVTCDKHDIDIFPAEALGGL
jgi:hypothetical protein